jgi:hypothetical protein
MILYNLFFFILPGIHAVAGTAAAILSLWGSRNEYKNLHTKDDGAAAEEPEFLISLSIHHSCPGSSTPEFLLSEKLI